MTEAVEKIVAVPYLVKGKRFLRVLQALNFIRMGNGSISFTVPVFELCNYKEVFNALGLEITDVRVRPAGDEVEVELFFKEVP